MRAINTHNKTRSHGGCFVVCGPTASGKSALADNLAERLSTNAVLIDSMQVYGEIPVITNQSRRRRAEISGIVSVTEDWSVAQHVSLVREFMGRPDAETVLDAGTGMYLNASILDVPLAERVDPQIRKRAERLVKGEPNPRRAARAKEIEISTGKQDERGSIWDANLLCETKVFYIKPRMDTLEASIKHRTKTIIQSGVPEAEMISEMSAEGRYINPSVLDSIGVRELVSFVRGDITLATAEERINIRTRRLAKRQIRWFDKLVKTIGEEAEIHILDSPNSCDVLRY